MANESGLPQEPHALSAGDVARHLRVQPDVGLAADEIDARLLRHGPNRLPETAPRSWLQRVLDPFRDFMIMVLLAAAVLSGFIGDIADTVAIAVIVLLNAVIAIVQEWRADRAMQALRQLAAPRARVLRDGRMAVVETSQLVLGDVVLLEAGDMIPADLRLHHVAQLRVDESALTGESVTAQKHAAPLPPHALPLGDQANMAFKGTLVTHGRATGIVIATGAATQLGQIAALVRAAGPRSTPLQLRLAAFGKRLSLVVLAICALIFAVGVLRGEPWLLMALTAVSLAVAAIPEALPAVVTVLLALGARAMVRVHALVRRLPAVETLGSVTVICSDKTGTLTLNRMRVKAWRTWGDLPAQQLWRAAALCNDAVPDTAAAAWRGDPTETALVEQAGAEGIDVVALRARQPRAGEIPFDAERKRMTTWHAAADDGANAPPWIAMTKGAPESVLPRCTHVLTRRGAEPLHVHEALDFARSLAAQGMRVLAVAQRDWHEQPRAEADAVERDMTLLGLVGLLDPPRPEAKQAVAECLAAGIIPVMITGDHPATALAIARELGIAAEGAKALGGAELAAMDAAALRDAVAHVRVYARMDPAQKIRIVAALQANGEFVAMTGDGVNDAPALRAADIGVAMGARGAAAAAQAADVVLLTDRLDRFAEALAIARHSRAIALESVVAGMGLSAIAMAAAAWGLLNPVAGAILQEVIDIAVILNALRALGIRPPWRRPRLLSAETAARLSREHRDLAEILDRIQAVADRIDTVPPDESGRDLAAIDRLLRDRLLPHEREDDATLYPGLAELLGGRDPLAAMSRTHREIIRLAGLFNRTVAHLDAAGPNRDDTILRDARRLLYGLAAILRLHFAQEEELFHLLTAPPEI